MIRVLLVDDHASFRQPLAFMFEREPDFTVVGQAGTVAEARGMLEGTDLAILDVDLPDGNGIGLVSALRSVNPHCQVMILTASSNQVQFAEAVEAGAVGVLNKATPISQIIDAARRVSSGEFLLSPREIVEMLRIASQHREHDRSAQAALASLTPREREVLQALAEGLNDKEIGQKLFVSTETARTHMVNILSKLGVESRLQALVFAVRHGAVKIG